VRAALDRALVAAPLIGGMVRPFIIANSCRTLGLLLKSGVALEESLTIVADATGNLAYKKAYQSLSRGVSRGEKVSVQLERSPRLFPRMVVQMISVGEKSGSLPDTLAYLAELYEAEVDDRTKNISTLVEPALMIVMGLIVGFIAVSIITPLYGITQNLHA
jgi:type IV pilus assembly protein PilC